MENKMMKLLPFEMNPQIRTYLNHAYAFGIVEGTFGNEIIPRLACETYVNCVYSRDNANKFYIYTYNDDGWFEKKGIISHDAHVCNDPDLKCVSEAVAIAAERISGGEYVYCCPNEGYFYMHNDGNPYDFDHECLLWGVDFEKKTFQTSGYVRGVYMPYEVGFDELTDALIHVQSGYVELLFYKADSDFEFEPLNVDNVVFLLSEYISSECSEQSGRADIKDYIDTGKLKFGIDVWDELASYLEEIGRSGGFLDMRYIRSFLDHKNLMNQRLKYLSENNYLRNAQIYRTKANEIYRTANNLFFMLMKYKCKRSDADEILSRAVEKIKEINRAERDYLNCLIHELSAI